ncbi:protein kinase 4-like [Oppia nitens]|uniref:protein kinase 4-like n=1 Tax=Oppia nitens TaxID=1686743 RepID=UPI0023DCBF85|nr:protein kinase 4-like [Oppia nitens]
MVKSAPLKSLLQHFLNHFETLETRHRLAIETSDESICLYRKEFQTLKELTEQLKTDPNCGSDEGENDVNRRKNRYKDILPYDHSRVILEEYPGVPGSDYMNANYVKGASGSPRAYIASQGPLPNTLVDFWRMMWESDVSVIVMACNEREGGKYKCESYWPEDSSEPQQYGNITVQLVKWRQVCPDFLVRTLKVTADSKDRTVCQFHYQTWPDHGVPNSVHPILELCRLMRDVQISETRPILIHCSAGCGRTGTLCSIDYVWALLRTGKLREDFSLYSIIRDMRKQRIAMVQTLEQYILCYKAVSTLFEQQLKMIDSHTYENIDGDGEPLMRLQLLTDPIVDDSLKSTSNESNINTKPSPQRMPSIVANSIHTSGGDEVRHQRLVGKATVIRRPSIAKLKAIFENQNPSSGQDMTPVVVRSRSTNSSLNRTQSIKQEKSRNSRSMIETNGLYSDYNNQMRQQNQLEIDNQNTNVVNDCHQTNYNDFSSVNELNKSMDNNNTQMVSNNNHHYSGPQFIEQSFTILNDQKLFHQNHQQLQQEIRQHIQQKQLQSVQQSAAQQMQTQLVATNVYQIDPQMSSQTQIQHQMTPSMQMSLNNGNTQSLPPPPNQSLPSRPPNQPLPPPPKPPRTYQYHHLLDGSIASLPNTSEGRLIVSVALPRRQPNDLNMNQTNIYEQIGQRAHMSDTLIVNTNNIDNFNNFNLNPHNTIKVLNVSNNNIYESVLPKYRRGQQLPVDNNGVPNVTHNQNIHSYYDIMKLRNPGLNQTIPFYDSIYGRHGFMTVPNLRHIPVPITQLHPFPQFKPNFESIYANTNPNPNLNSNANPNIVNNHNNVNSNSNNNQNNVNLSKTKSEPNIKSNTERITNNLANNIEKPDNIKNSIKKSKKMEKKEKNTNNLNTKSNHKNESMKKKTANSTSNLPTATQQESTSGTFGSKLSNAFRGLKIKSSTKSKSNTNLNHSTSTNNVTGSHTVTRPPHSHRFSPPTQWTQV